MRKVGTLSFPNLSHSILESVLNKQESKKYSSLFQGLGESQFIFVSTLNNTLSMTFRMKSFICSDTICESMGEA
jgi:hypothetical protein